MFKKGQSGNPNGRPRGTVRRLINVPEILESRNYCPIHHAIELIMDEKTKMRDKIELIKMLADKCAPNFKAVEYSGDKEAPVLFNFNLPTVK